jgi:hypothetical protein
VVLDGEEASEDVGVMDMHRRLEGGEGGRREDTLDIDAQRRNPARVFPLFSLVFPLFLISILSDGPCLGSILSDGPQLVSHGRRNPGLLRYSLCGPGRPAAHDYSRDPDQRLRCTDGVHSPAPSTQRRGHAISHVSARSEAQPYAPLPTRSTEATFQKHVRETAYRHLPLAGGRSLRCTCNAPTHGRGPGLSCR